MKRHLTFILALVVVALSAWAFSTRGENPASPYFEENFTSVLAAQAAPETYIMALRHIYEGRAPDAEVLADLGNNLDRRFGYFPSDTGDFERGWTMLELAVRWGNLDAVRVLLTNGADPALAGEEIVRKRDSEAEGESEWAFSIGALALYLDHGGPTGYVSDKAQFPLLDVALGSGNYPAAWMLIEAGADPFQRVRGLFYPERMAQGRSEYVVTDPGMTEDQIQFLIELQDRGYIDDAPPQALDYLYGGWGDVLDLLQTSRSPDYRPIRQLLLSFFEQSLARDAIKYPAEAREAVAQRLRQQIEERG